MRTFADEHARFFDATNFGVVATVGPDGAPQTSVVWIDWDGETVRFNTTNARAKGRNLRREPRLSVTVVDRDDPYRYIEVEGTAELDEDGAAEHIHALARKYTGEDFHTPVDRITVRVIPERVLAYGF